jgi:hypothetical protein
MCTVRTQGVIIAVALNGDELFLTEHKNEPKMQSFGNFYPKLLSFGGFVATART